jgi:hypothetical protein
MNIDDEVADIVALLADEPPPKEEAQSAPAAATEHQRRVAGVAAVVPGPSVLADGLVEAVQDDLRAHGIVTGGNAVRVLEAVDLMLTQDEHFQRFGALVIKTIAQKTGLDVQITDDPTVPGESRRRE